MLNIIISESLTCLYQLLNDSKYNKLVHIKLNINAITDSDCSAFVLFISNWKSDGIIGAT